MTVHDDLRAWLRTILFRGSFWEGEPVERFLDGLVNTFGPTAERILAIPATVAPFEAERPILLQWYDFLAKVSCVAVPVDTEDLRERVLALLAADSTAFPDGLERAVLAYLPLLELNDQLPLSILGWNDVDPPIVWEIPAPLDPWWAIVEAWYPPLLVPEEQVVCVLRPFIPGVAEPRPVAPVAIYHVPVASTLAGGIGLHWRQMRADTVLVLERRLTVGGALQETVTFNPVDVEGRELISDLFPLLSAATDISGQTLIANWTRTWAGQTSQVIVDTTLDVA